MRYIPREEREPEEEPAPREVAMHWLAQAAELFDAGSLKDIPATWRPNCCDVQTRTEVRRCDQCLERVRLLYLYPAEKPRRVLCAVCTRSRVHAGVVLRREQPWFISGDDPPAYESEAA